MSIPAFVAQTLLYAGLVFGCGVIGLTFYAALMGHTRDSLGDDALGEVGEGLGVKAFGAHYGEDK